MRVPQTTLSQVICWKDSQNSPRAVVYIKGAGESQPSEPARGTGTRTGPANRPGEPAQGTSTRTGPGNRPREPAHGQVQGTGPGNRPTDRSGGCTCRDPAGPSVESRGWRHAVGEAHLSSGVQGFCCGTITHDLMAQLSGPSWRRGYLPLDSDKDAPWLNFRHAPLSPLLH